MTKPIASLSLDLDNKWCYLRTHGIAGWEKYPSYLEVVVPRILRFCVEQELLLTCFIVGRDTQQPCNREPLLALVEAGHEVGNHTLNHYPWLHTLSRGEAELEVGVAERQIELATGQRPVGFRGPGYSLSTDVLEILAERGYWYDASTLPTFIGPLARWYVCRTSTAADAKRRDLFGSFWEGLRPLRPYTWSTAAGQLLEIPVTTFPLLKVPIHMTYLWYVRQLSVPLACTYFRAAMKACRLTGVSPSLLLHPLDFLGAEDEPELHFFPGMNVPRAAKWQFISEVLAIFQQHFDVQPLSIFARSIQPDLALPETLVPIDGAREPVVAS